MTEPPARPGRLRRLLPPSATSDSAVLLQTRATRALADGLVSTVLSAYLVSLGLSGGRIGIIITATLLGSAALTLAAGLGGYRFSPRHLLLAASGLMIATGLLFGWTRSFPMLIVVGFIGTMNPTAGDVSVFLPTEQAALAGTVSAQDRTAIYARYAVVGFSSAAVGALAANVVHGRGVFAVYAAAGLVCLWRYSQLSSAAPAPHLRPEPLRESRGIVLRLAALFSLDAFGGGFVVQSLLALWLLRRFDLSVGAAGTIFFWSGLLSGLSGLAAPRVAARIGLIRTMVFSHLPANALLIAAAFMPNAPLAIACLLARSALSQMDVPARQSYVMAVVRPAERAAAASVTNVPRSLASALTPFAAGWMLDHSDFGWPLIAGGTCKAIYDLALLAVFRNVRPPEEMSR